ncbi:hypothetical protein [Vibrio genomosp. F10]|uniref:hypothetical protein n=1 Tax=Vibrio genomosp. F10 TaxID=723171 RepID=UPI0002EFACA3|nr:hypothetical protein [Vibrio genomosp. F10]
MDNGVKSLEHGFMFKAEMAEKFNQQGAFIATNLTAFSPDLATIPVVQDPLIQKKLHSAQAAFGTYQQEMAKAEVDGFIAVHSMWTVLVWWVPVPSKLTTKSG